MKVAAFDFDGTLHHPNSDGGGFRRADLEAIEAWRAAGNLAVAATGRSRAALAHGMQGSTLQFDYQVLSNGASAATGDGAELIFAYPIDPDVLRAAIDTFRDQPGMAVFGTTIGAVDGVFANNTGDTSNLTAHFTRMTEADIPDYTFAVVPLWVPEDDQLRADVVAWAEALGGVTVAQNQTYVDIMAPGRTKGAGVLELLEQLRLDRDGVELYTFGDSWNDLSMHEIADHSHSFRHSPADVQAATHNVIGSVAEAINTYL
ncbi:Cof-type HAD-IIB family hydrolase [Corynebacterium sp. TA-R-1]|uniref:Cof-type HAD-IIB family hydrolase n=1 Tax=Corynebacterium stercoris TaxID=2943490 RepID=A0ABT1G1A0_9CORY|nr:HAD family hydrolase [Corynebacterium stercoris]MCP1387786.1 Cof-type HAD-IIB family hydrolase [Corynebacterium stercoris]